MAGAFPVASLDSRAALVIDAQHSGLRDRQFEMQLASEFGRKDPLAGTAICTQLSSPENPAAYPALEALLAGWTPREPQEASAWVAEQRGQPWYDAAAGSMAVGLARSDAGAAAEWADSIQDLALRQRIEERLAQFPRRTP